MEYPPNKINMQIWNSFSRRDSNTTYSGWSSEAVRALVNRNQTSCVFSHLSKCSSIAWLYLTCHFVVMLRNETEERTRFAELMLTKSVYKTGKREYCLLQVLPLPFHARDRLNPRYFTSKASIMRCVHDLCDILIRFRRFLGNAGIGMAPHHDALFFE